MAHAKMQLLLLFTLFVANANCFSDIDLGGVWMVKDTEDEYEMQATVPGGIYSDLMDNNIIGDVFFGFNDVETRWVSGKNWSYSRTFTATDSVLSYTHINLVFEGLDTFATIYLNAQIVGKTDNMFVRYSFNVKNMLKQGENLIEVHFISPVLMAAHLFDIQAKDYKVPPECPPDEYKGECAVNHIRKVQASFAWDWGPAFPSMGIWKPVHVHAYNSTVIEDVTVYVDSNAETNSWDLTVNTYFAYTTVAITGTVTVDLDTDIDTVTYIYDVELKCKADTPHSASFTVPKSHVQRWWPNGYGAQKLYKMSVTFQATNYESTSKTFKIGFRTVNLVQNSVDGNPANGLSFYFVVNGVTIFAKGTNSIPINILPEKGKNSTTIRFLLKSAKDVHMNMIRVWGGGTYESDEFYEVADELGILVWQDFMFACAMYPVNEEFLDSVKLEVKHQVRRLQHHPSVFIWAANNENEAALRQNWYGTAHNFALYKSDYIKLYIDTIRTEVFKSDTSRQFLTSSPTNGLQSELEGYVAIDPASSFFGDVHFYNYMSDSWDQNIYPIPRFASEYGFQSLPRLETLLMAANDTDDLQFNSIFMDHRQHHPGGNEEMQNLISKRLPLVEPSNSNFYKAFIFYSQIHQAVGTKLQTERYRSYRSTVNSENEGLTLGALYWQLNDVWVAPTWSGIDFDNNWKMLHYYARNFFAPVIITGELSTSRNLKVLYCSDLMTNIYNASATISVYSWNSTEEIYSQHYNINIMAGLSKEIVTVWIDTFLENAGCGSIANARYNCFIILSITDSDDKLIAPENFVFPAPLKTSKCLNANVRITNVDQVDDDGYEFSVEVETDEIAVFVWLNANNLRGTFSDNGFMLVTTTKIVYFTTEEKATIDVLQNSITVTHMMDSTYF